jgi:hypothetical protein
VLDHLGELGLEAPALPLQIGFEAAIRASRDLDEAGADPVPHRGEDAVAFEESGQRSFHRTSPVVGSWPVRCRRLSTTIWRRPPSVATSGELYAASSSPPAQRLTPVSAS